MEKIKNIFLKINPSAIGDIAIVPFLSEEDGAEYSVWKITCRDRTLVLKKAKGREIDIYSSFFADANPGVPKFLGYTDFENDRYFLMEYVSGRPMLVCDKDSVIKALDALIALQERFWGYSGCERSFFEESLVSREKRAEYISSYPFASLYEEYLSEYRTVKRTLCHDDLLPFNVMISDSGAAIVDWEVAGILPYPTSLARLIAHCEEESDAFFYMTERDKAFAIDYYYENFVKHKGISYDLYRRTLDLFIFYEYCEWIMLGKKTGQENGERYLKYLAKAEKLALSFAKYRQE